MDHDILRSYVRLNSVQKRNLGTDSVFFLGGLEKRVTVPQLGEVIRGQVKTRPTSHSFQIKRVPLLFSRKGIRE